MVVWKVFSGDELLKISAARPLSIKRFGHKLRHKVLAWEKLPEQVSSLGSDLRSTKRLTNASRAVKG